MTYQAFDITTRSAALLNDTNKTIFSDTAQIPYLNIALSDLERRLQLSNVPVTDDTSLELPVLAGDVTINPPDGLVDIHDMWEKPSGISDASYTRMTRLSEFPKYLAPASYLTYFIWQTEQIKIIGATQDITVKIDYIKNIFTEVANPNDDIDIINGIDYLSYRTAALCAQFIGENPERAAVLNGEATEALDNLLGISTKARQVITTRRRPFMSSYRRFGRW